MTFRIQVASDKEIAWKSFRAIAIQQESVIDTPVDTICVCVALRLLITTINTEITAPGRVIIST